MAYMNMKKSTIITALTAIMMMAVTPAFAQEEDNGEHQLSGFKKFNVREDFTENGFQWFHGWMKMGKLNCLVRSSIGTI